MTDALSIYYKELQQGFADYFSDRVKTITIFTDSYQQTDNDVPQAIATPAIIIEIDTIKPAATYQQSAHDQELELSAHCVLGWKTKNIQLELTHFASEVVKLLTNKDCTLQFSTASQAFEIEATPSALEISEGDTGFDSWAVRFNQVLHLSEPWKAENIISNQIFWQPQN